MFCEIFSVLIENGPSSTTNSWKKKIYCDDQLEHFDLQHCRNQEAFISPIFCFQDLLGYHCPTVKDSDSESPPQAARAVQTAPAVPAVPVATTEAAPAIVALRQRAEAKQWVCGARKWSFLLEKGGCGARVTLSSHVRWLMSWSHGGCLCFERLLHDKSKCAFFRSFLMVSMCFEHVLIDRYLICKSSCYQRHRFPDIEIFTYVNLRWLGMLEREASYGFFAGTRPPTSVT